VSLIDRRGGWFRRWSAAALVGAVLLLLLYVPLAICAAGIATAAAAGLALIGAVVTLDHADVTAKRGRTAEYRARWDHPDLLAARIAAADFLSVPESDQDARWREWKAGMETKKRLLLMAILNFWEEVSSAYNQDLLDGDWFCTDLAWELQYAWERAEWFIRKYRTEDQNASGYCEWQMALEAVRGDVERQLKVGRLRAERALARNEDVLYVDQRDPLDIDS
jgi:hypothetical protein